MLSPARSQRVLGARDITKVLNFDQKESSLCYNIGPEAKVALRRFETFYNHRKIG